MPLFSNALDFVFRPQPKQPGDYGPEWDPGFGTGSSTGPDNPFEAEDGTPAENGGDNVWAPGYGTGSSTGDDNPFAAGGYDDAWF